MECGAPNTVVLKDPATGQIKPLEVYLMSDSWVDDVEEVAACIVHMEEHGIEPVLPTWGAYPVANSCGRWHLLDESIRQRGQVRACFCARISPWVLAAGWASGCNSVCVPGMTRARQDSCAPCRDRRKQTLTHSETWPTTLSTRTHTGIPRQVGTSAAVQRCGKPCRRRHGRQGGGPQQSGGHRPPNLPGGLQPGARSPPACAPAQRRRWGAAPCCVGLQPRHAPVAPACREQRAQGV